MGRLIVERELGVQGQQKHEERKRDDKPLDLFCSEVHLGTDSIGEELLSHYNPDFRAEAARAQPDCKHFPTMLQGFTDCPLNLRSGVLLNEKPFSSIQSCCNLISDV